MAKRVYQVRYYGKNKATNYPKSLTDSQMRSGAIFSKRTPIKQLGIQTLPGIKFYLNNSIEPIVVGATGIYELNVENLAEITALAFDKTAIETINNNGSSYIIVDIMYEVEEE